MGNFKTSIPERPDGFSKPVGLFDASKARLNAANPEALPVRFGTIVEAIGGNGMFLVGVDGLMGLIPCGLSSGVSRYCGASRISLLGAGSRVTCVVLPGKSAGIIIGSAHVLVPIDEGELLKDRLEFGRKFAARVNPPEKLHPLQDTEKLGYPGDVPNGGERIPPDAVTGEELLVGDFGQMVGVMRSCSVLQGGPLNWVRMYPVTGTTREFAWQYEKMTCQGLRDVRIVRGMIWDEEHEAHSMIDRDSESEPGSKLPVIRATTRRYRGSLGDVEQVYTVIPGEYDKEAKAPGEDTGLSLFHRGISGEIGIYTVNRCGLYKMPVIPVPIKKSMPGPKPERGAARLPFINGYLDAAKMDAGYLEGDDVTFLKDGAEVVYPFSGFLGPIMRGFIEHPEWAFQSLEALSKFPPSGDLTVDRYPDGKERSGINHYRNAAHIEIDLYGNISLRAAGGAELRLGNQVTLTAPRGVSVISGEDVVAVAANAISLDSGMVTRLHSDGIIHERSAVRSIMSESMIIGVTSNLAGGDGTDYKEFTDIGSEELQKTMIDLMAMDEFSLNNAWELFRPGKLHIYGRNLSMDAAVDMDLVARENARVLAGERMSVSSLNVLSLTYQGQAHIMSMATGRSAGILFRHSNVGFMEVHGTLAATGDITSLGGAVKSCEAIQEGIYPGDGYVLPVDWIKSELFMDRADYSKSITFRNEARTKAAQTRLIPDDVRVERKDKIPKDTSSVPSGGRDNPYFMWTPRPRSVEMAGTLSKDWFDWSEQLNDNMWDLLSPLDARFPLPEENEKNIKVENAIRGLYNSSSRLQSRSPLWFTMWDDLAEGHLPRFLKWWERVPDTRVIIPMFGRDGKFATFKTKHGEKKVNLGAIGGYKDLIDMRDWFTSKDG